VWIGLGVLVVLVLILRLTFWSPWGERFALGPRVAVVKVEGPIFSAETTVRTLNRYAEREDVKAVVLRIESPGGGVAASQEIYERVKSLNTIKPVVASMGGIAASGGYYIALGCRRIMANPGTITGSIGVIMEYPVATELLGKVGLEMETIKSGALKDAGSPTRPPTEADRVYFQGVIDNLHQQFVRAVVEGRHLSESQVTTLANGQVFTGEQSLTLGLIDTLGTLEAAISLAGELSGIKGKPNVLWERRKRPSLIDFLFGKVEQTASRWWSARPAYRWRWE